MDTYSLLRERNQPLVAHLVTLCTGNLQLYAGANPISWHDLIDSFIEDKTSIRCIAPLNPPLADYKMLMTCVNELGTTFYAVKSLEQS